MSEHGGARAGAGRRATSLAELIADGSFDAGKASHKNALFRVAEHAMPSPEALSLDPDDERDVELCELCRLYARYRTGGWRSESVSIARLFERRVRDRAQARTPSGT